MFGDKWMRWKRNSWAVHSANMCLTLHILLVFVCVCVCAIRRWAHASAPGKEHTRAERRRGEEGIQRRFSLTVERRFRWWCVCDRHIEDEKKSVNGKSLYRYVLLLYSLRLRFFLFFFSFIFYFFYLLGSGLFLLCLWQRNERIAPTMSASFIEAGARDDIFDMIALFCFV